MHDKNLGIQDAMVAVIAALVAAGLAGCSGAASSTTGPDLVAGDTGRVVIVSQTFDRVNAGEERFVDFSLSRAGTLAVRVGWTDQDNSVVAVLASAGCPYLRRADDCEIRGSVSEQRGRDERESRISYRAAAGAYRLWLRNLGPATDSINVTAELYFAADAPSPAPAPSPGPGRPERPDRPEGDPRRR